MEESYISFSIYTKDENQWLIRKNTYLQRTSCVELLNKSLGELVELLVEKSKDVFEDEECLLDKRPQKIDIYRVYDLSSF